MTTPRFLIASFVVSHLFLAVLAMPASAGKDDPSEPEWHFDLGWLRMAANEQEPNGSCEASQTLHCEEVAQDCSIQPAGDVDWYCCYAAAGDLLLAATDAVPGQPLVDTIIELLAPDCVTLVRYDDDHGPGNYSMTTPYLVPVSGVYHLKVRSHSSMGTGQYQVFFVCTPPPLGACCFADGSCLSLWPYECLPQGGVYQGDNTSCEPNPCSQPPQACCFSNGDCQLETVEVCAEQGGQSLPPGSACEPNPCPQPPQACCFEDGGCSMELTENCVTLGGAPQGTGSVCEPNPCPQPPRSCCFADGSCQMLTAPECIGAGGELAGTPSCDPNPCPQACCYEDGLCLFLAEDGCLEGGGTPMGAGTSCDPNPCPGPPVSACCFADQVCVPLTEQECADGGGLYQGDEVPCDPNPCPPTATEGTTWGRIKGIYR